MDGIILKALSGFYYVSTSDGVLVACRARGKLRHQHISPLVGDHVRITISEDDTGMVDEIYPRDNEFYRPSIANIDQLVLVVSEATPATDPFLIDRVISIAESQNCQPIICINKCDLARADSLYAIYQAAGFPILRVSTKSGEGIPELKALLAGKVSAFTGNSGVGKSSILNTLHSGIQLQVGEVSVKLGRGRHTTRHVELFQLENGTVVADTPGFSSFEVSKRELEKKEELAATFREFRPYLNQYQFIGCSHRTEKGCAVLKAVTEGSIAQSRHSSYVRLYEQTKEYKDWE